MSNTRDAYLAMERLRHARSVCQTAEHLRDWIHGRDPRDYRRFARARVRVMRHTETMEAHLRDYEPQATHPMLVYMDHVSDELYERSRRILKAL